MASETVDPIDWSHPPPYTGQYPLSSTYCTVQCGLQITRLTTLTEMRTCDLLNAMPTHCLCDHSGYMTWSLLYTTAANRCYIIICYGLYTTAVSLCSFEVEEINYSHVEMIMMAYGFMASFILKYVNFKNMRDQINMMFLKSQNWGASISTCFGK